MNLPPCILASASPRRVELLRNLGVKFSVEPGHAEEIQPEHLTPQETAEINAFRKARLIAQRHPDELVLGADTIVCLGKELFGKPSSLAHAEEMLGCLQGRAHQVITGVCLLHLRERRQKCFSDHTTVLLRPLSSKQIRYYLERINPLDKAGGYAIQEHGELIVQEIKGSYSNVVGLPLERLREELEIWALRCPALVHGAG